MSAAPVLSEDLFRLPIPRWLREAIPVALILAVFVALCLPALGPWIVPTAGDEMDSAYLFPFNLMRRGEGPAGIGSNHIGMYNLTFWTRALPMRMEWFRENAETWNRIYCLITTTMLQVLVYFFARRMHGHLFGVIVLFVSAFAHYGLYLGTEGNWLNETAFLALGTVWLLLEGERRERWWARFGMGIATGLGLTLCLWAYYSGRGVFITFAGYALLRCMSDRKWLKRQLPLGIGLVLAVSPALVKFRADMKRDPNFATYRQTKTQLLYRPQVNWALDAYRTDSVILMTAKNMARTLTAYWEGPNNYHSYESPHGFVDRISVFALMAGMAWMLWRWRRPEYLLLLLLFAVSNLILSGLTMLPYPPYHQRVHIGIQIAWIAVALPIFWLATRTGRWRAAGQWSAALLLFAIAFVNCGLYFGRVFDTRDRFIAHYSKSVVVAEYVERMIRNYDIIVQNAPNTRLWPFTSQMSHRNPHLRIPNAVMWDLNFYRSRARDGWKPATDGKGLLFMIEAPVPPQVRAEIERSLPGGRWIREDVADGPLLEIYAAPRQTTPADAPAR